jgi:signal transduction histidine kinase
MRLARVISNLLSNAARFTAGSGEIKVTLSQETRDGRRWAVVSVADDGVGIPADDVPHVFDRFYRATNVTGKIAGTGLGLASAKQIVEQHGGAIGIASQVNIGTTVTVTLPMD